MLTVADLRLRLDTQLGDTALQSLLDSAYQAIEQRVEPSGPITEYLSARGELLMLSRPADVISDVLEFVWAGQDGVELDDTDFELRSSGQTLRRLTTGTNPSRWWRGKVSVTYLPRDDEALRDSVAVQLISLDVNTKFGLTSQTIGTWSESYESRPGYGYAEQRESILESLKPMVGILL